MTRFVGVALAGMILFAGAARAQTWPSDGKVFHDVYGQVNADGASVRWDAAKESKPSPSEGHSFAETGQEMSTKVLLRAEVDGKLYVATSAVPKVPENEKCHACGAALGGAVYARANGGWKLEAASPAAIYAGGWGEPPVGMELLRCGERTYCFAVEGGFTGQGYTDVSLKVYGLVGGAMRGLLTVPVESDDPGGSTTMSASVRFVARASKSPLFDAEVMTVRGNAAELTRYRYRDGEYSVVSSRTLDGARAKTK